MLITTILKINRGLPSYNYYLDVADFLTDDSHRLLKNSECLWKIDKKIQEIENAISMAIFCFYEEQDLENRDEVKIKGFIEKKIKVKKNLSELKEKFEKKLVKFSKN